MIEIYLPSDAIGAISYGYANIFVTAPSPENLKTVFEFVISGLKALHYSEHIDFEVQQFPTSCLFVCICWILCVCWKCDDIVTVSRRSSDCPHSILRVKCLIKYHVDLADNLQ